MKTPAQIAEAMADLQKRIDAFNTDCDAQMALLTIERAKIVMDATSAGMAKRHVDGWLRKLPKADHVGSELGLPPASDPLALPDTLKRT